MRIVIGHIIHSNAVWRIGISMPSKVSDISIRIKIIRGMVIYWSNPSGSRSTSINGIEIGWFDTLQFVITIGETCNISSMFDCCTSSCLIWNSRCPGRDIPVVQIVCSGQMMIVCIRISCPYSRSSAVVSVIIIQDHSESIFCYCIRQSILSRILCLTQTWVVDSFQPSLNGVYIIRSLNAILSSDFTIHHSHRIVGIGFIYIPNDFITWGLCSDHTVVPIIGIAVIEFIQIGFILIIVGYLQYIST